MKITKKTQTQEVSKKNIDHEYIKNLVGEVLKDEIEKIETKLPFHALVAHILSPDEKKIFKEMFKGEFNKIERKLNKLKIECEKVLGHLNKYVRKGTNTAEHTVKKIESFEESLLYILHNIKKNQFLYAHYPDDWVKNYQNIKDGIKEENKYLDTRSKV